MATPVGLLPVVTAGTGCVPVNRFTTEAVPSPWFATTATPKRGLTATPWGEAPTAMLLFTAPKVVLLGFMSMMETLLQPLLLTTATGEKAAVASWSATATE